MNTEKTLAQKMRDLSEASTATAYQRLLDNIEALSKQTIRQLDITEHEHNTFKDFLIKDGFKVDHKVIFKGSLSSVITW